MLVIGAIVVGIAGVWAAGMALFAYNEATKIDRSDPEVVTDEYLRAALVHKDQVGAQLYSCSDQAKLDSIRALRDDLDKRERDFGVSIVVTWGAYERSGADLSTALTIVAIKDGNEQSSSEQRWRFTLIDDDGWWVCGAEKVQENPT